MKRATEIAILNSAIAAGLVFAGAFVTGQISLSAIIAAAAAAMLTFLTNLKQFFANIKHKKGMISLGLFNFYGR